MYPRLIGLGGYAGCGKDTAGDELVARLGFEKFSFSDALYLEVSAAFDIAIDFLKDRDHKEQPTEFLALWRCRDEGFVDRMIDAGWGQYQAHSPRDILQAWGTEYRREQDPDYWVKRARDHYRARIAAGAVGLVNCSARFENEAKWIREEGGLVLRVVRPGVTAVNAHVSDKPLPEELVDGEVENAGTRKVLFENLVRAFNARAEAA